MWNEETEANVVGGLVVTLLLSYWYVMSCLPNETCFKWLCDILYGG